MKVLIGAATIVLLSGCSALPPAVQRASDAYDESLIAAEVWICRGASGGAIMRHYGRDEKTWAAWRHLCGYAGAALERPEPQ